MLCVLAVFVPSFFMVGAAKAMFVPLSLAVGFSMVASYLLSSTLVPILSVWVLRGHKETLEKVVEEERKLETGFAKFQKHYAGFAQKVVGVRWLVVVAYLAAAAVLIVFLGRQLGTEIFPRVDAGQLQVRLRAPTGTHVDGTEAIALQALDLIKGEVGANNVAIALGFIGVHGSSYPINLIYLWNGGSEEGVVQVQLKPGTPVRIEELKERLRKKFTAQLTEATFSFEPSDIVSRVMSLGAPTPIEVAVSGPNLAADREFAEKVREELRKIPTLRDVQFGQALDYPTVDVVVNRERAGLMGVKMAEVSRSLVAAASSSRFVVPNFWADPNSGVAYQIQVQIPQNYMDSVEAAQNVPVAYRNGEAILLRNIASVTEGTTPGQYERYNMQRMITVTANIGGADLGSVAKAVMNALRELGSPPPKVNIAVRGQVVPMQQMLDGLQTGLLLAVVVIFLLLAASCQSVKLSSIVVSTVPAVIAGVVLTLWLTGTTLNIQSFMGAIMAVGVAVANAVLLVTFAERSRIGGAAADVAAVEGAQSRLRPIVMTSLALLGGMRPIAAGLRERFGHTGHLGSPAV